MWGCSAVGARFLGMEEVVGSTPTSSTNNLPNRVVPRENITPVPLQGRGFLIGG